MTKRSRSRDAVVCPQCGYEFPPGRASSGMIKSQRDQQRGDEATQRASDRTLELERAERAGELVALRELLADRRAEITKLREEELALRRRDLELETQ